MFIKIHNASSDDVVYANVRMSRDVYQAMRAWFHVAQEQDSSEMRMPQGCFIVKQGYGWYKIVNFRTHNGVQKVEGAIKLLRKFYNEYCRERNAEIRRQYERLKGQSKIVAYVDSNKPAPSNFVKVNLRPDDPVHNVRVLATRWGAQLKVQNVV